MMTRLIPVSFVYDIQPPLEVILDFDVPESLWEECNDNEDELIQKSIEYILVPSLINYSEKLKANLDSNGN